MSASEIERRLGNIDSKFNHVFDRLFALDDRVLALEKPIAKVKILAYLQDHPGSTINQVLEPFRDTPLWIAAQHVAYDRAGLLDFAVEERHGKGHPRTYRLKEA